MASMPETVGSTPPASFGACDCVPPATARRRSSSGHLTRLLAHALQAETLAGQSGLLQQRDARFKTGAMLAVILATTWAHHVASVWCIVLLAATLAMSSRVPLKRMALQAWIPVLAFTGLIAAPALFLVPGPALATLPLTGSTITATGLASAVMLVGRAEAAASMALLLVLTTPWSQVVRALGALGVPAAITAMLAMTQRYIFSFLQSAADMQEAHHSRIMTPVNAAGRRRMIASAAGVLFTRSLDMGQNVHEAMIARGYRGQSLSLDTWRPELTDWVMLGLALALLAAVIGLNL